MTVAVLNAMTSFLLFGLFVLAHGGEVVVNETIDLVSWMDGFGQARENDAIPENLFRVRTYTVHYPLDLYKRELVVRENLVSRVPDWWSDVLLWGEGPPPKPWGTKVGGWPYIRKDFDWPRSESGVRLNFYFQVNFSHSEDLLGELDLPGGMLLVFAESDEDLRLSPVLRWQDYIDDGDVIVAPSDWVGVSVERGGLLYRTPGYRRVAGEGGETSVISRYFATEISRNIDYERFNNRLEGFQVFLAIYDGFDLPGLGVDRERWPFAAVGYYDPVDPSDNNCRENGIRNIDLGGRLVFGLQGGEVKVLFESE